MKKKFVRPQISVTHLAPVEIIATSGAVKHAAQHAGQHFVYHIIKGMFGG